MSRPQSESASSLGGCFPLEGERFGAQPAEGHVVGARAVHRRERESPRRCRLRFFEEARCQIRACQHDPVPGRNLHLRPERVTHELQPTPQCPHAVIALTQQEVGECEPQ